MRTPSAPENLFTYRELAFALGLPPSKEYALRRALRRLGYLGVDLRPRPKYNGTLFRETRRRNCSTAHHSTYRVYITPQGMKALLPILSAQFQKGA